MSSLKRGPLFVTRRRIQLGFLAFTAAMFLLLFLLLTFSYTQVKRQTLLDLRNDAEELSRVIERRLLDLTAAEEQRAFEEYSFYNVYADKLLSGPAVVYSPLAQVNPKSSPPGTLGYFQIDPYGKMQTPLLPEEALTAKLSEKSGLRSAEVEKRLQVFAKVTSLLHEEPHGPPHTPELPPATKLGERLYKKPPQAAPEAVAGSSFFNYLSAGPSTEPAEKSSLAERLHQGAQAMAAEQLEKARKAIDDAQESIGTTPRQEESDRPAELQSPTPSGPSGGGQSVNLTGETEPLRVRILNNAKAVFFRVVWRDQSRYVQGLLVDMPVLLTQVIEPAYWASYLRHRVGLMAGLDRKRLLDLRPGGPPAKTRAEEVLLYRRSLAAPFQKLELLYWMERIPFSFGALLVVVLGSVLTFVLVAGVLLLYSLVLAQVDLAEKKNDFVSAVSHELKTPLTSIRLYAEMLKAGWVADEAKRKDYFEFIFNESERLSRLIGKVLQFARAKKEAPPELKRLTAGALMDLAGGKVKALVQAAAFELAVEIPADAAQAVILADEDAFVQIVINLVENALKFSKSASRKTVLLGCRLEPKRRFGNQRIVFFVRDFGQGVTAGHERRIFDPFYRAESELVRSTPGTGLGLAVVKELTGLMRATVAVANLSPGAEFRVIFKAL